MLTAAQTSLYSLLKAAWPTGAQLLGPDDRVDFETALGDPDSANIVVRFYTPTGVTTSSGLGRLTAHVDVCSRTAKAAREAADQLLKQVPSHARAPNGALKPTATPIREASYHRVHIAFTLIADAIEE